MKKTFLALILVSLTLTLQAGNSCHDLMQRWDASISRINTLSRDICQMREAVADFEQDVLLAGFTYPPSWDDFNMEVVTDPYVVEMERQLARMQTQLRDLITNRTVQNAIALDLIQQLVAAECPVDLVRLTQELQAAMYELC